MAYEKKEIGWGRREFLIKTGMAAFGLTAALAGCAGPELKEKPSLATEKQPEKVVYPRLPGQKVQPPESGCLIGFRRAVSDHPGQTWKERFYNYGDYYEKHLGRNPSIIVLMGPWSFLADFREESVSLYREKGMIPYVFAKTFKDEPRTAKIEAKLDLRDIVNGKNDDLVEKFAINLTKYGDRYGGFFITTMEESNADWYYWGQSSNFVPAWRHIWEIFDNKGCNKYATWVWEVYCPEGAGRRTVHPDMMYPGDKYVDWIGLSAFSRKKYGGGTLESLAGNTYEQMRKNHPEKPIMQAEFAVSNDGAQPRWLHHAYQSIKESMPGMKAAIFHDNVTVQEGDDHTLSNQSLKTLKEIFKDPYWIMAKREIGSNLN